VTARVLFIFLDGVGIGPSDAGVNPFLGAGDRIPTLQRLTGGRIPTLEAPHLEGPDGTSFPLDATLGVEGIPQSGTGQAALLTGESTAELYGRHFGPWTPVSLRPLVEERSVLRRAAAAGRTVAFANAYPRDWPGPRRGPRRGRNVAGPPLAARGAGVLTRHETELGQGLAVSSEIVNDGWRAHLGHDWLPAVTPEKAGENLARIAADADLTLFAHYSTDTVGHRGGMDEAIEALVRVDLFLEGVTNALASDTLLLVASDHGNLEDIRGGHTRNPALGLAAGPGAGRAGALRDLREVAGFVLEVLGAER
jgi:hypothetical protein